jgi:hypothetical protein
MNGSFTELLGWDKPESRGLDYYSSDQIEDSEMRGHVA